MPYVPPTDAPFTARAKYLIAYTRDHLTEFNIQPETFKPVPDLRAAFEAAYAKALYPGRGKVYAAGKTRAGDALEKAFLEYGPLVGGGGRPVVRAFPGRGGAEGEAAGGSRNGDPPETDGRCAVKGRCPDQLRFCGTDPRAVAFTGGKAGKAPGVRRRARLYHERARRRGKESRRFLVDGIVMRDDSKPE